MGEPVEGSKKEISRATRKKLNQEGQGKPNREDKISYLTKYAKDNLSLKQIQEAQDWYRRPLHYINENNYPPEVYPIVEEAIRRYFVTEPTAEKYIREIITLQLKEDT